MCTQVVNTWFGSNGFTKAEETQAATAPTLLFLPQGRKKEKAEWKNKEFVYQGGKFFSVISISLVAAGETEEADV